MALAREIWAERKGPGDVDVLLAPPFTSLHAVEDVVRGSALLLAAHPGAPARPVHKGASGGELSRVMLAIEVVFAGADPVPVMVFDEVDAGVGGQAAGEIGRRLARLAGAHQVVVVTHLAQVAAFADTHIVVDKSPDTGAVLKYVDAKSWGFITLTIDKKWISGVTTAVDRAAQVKQSADTFKYSAKPIILKNPKSVPTL